ncbi:hypothetical protein DRP07_01260 [Archaeoglobales archaeon]|nr:MAG: hypothetical protein DRP07_01260 [Archaeoglobales archaeon]
MDMSGLLITTARGEEFPGKFEAEEILASIGVEARVEETGIKGLLVVEIEKPIEAVRQVSQLVQEKPELFLHTKRYIPLERVVKTDIEDIKNAVEVLLPKIGEKETFRITVEKRHTTLHSRDVIESIAKIVDRKVDLKNPDWIVLIEIFGGRTGVSVIRPNEIVSAVKS